VISRPRVSFIITTFNAEKFIGDTIENLLRTQYEQPYELVIVDDGSTDNTADICQKLARKDSKLRFYAEGRLGRAKALNKAVQYAGGEFIAINDADDQSCRERLSLVIPKLEQNPEVAMVSTQCIKAAEGLPVDLSSCTGVGESTESQGLDALSLYRKNSITHSTVIFRKAAWEKCGGYNEEMRLCIDYDFYFRILTVGKILELEAITVRHLLTRDTFFKKQSSGEYLRAYISVKKLARKLFDIPMVFLIYDIKILFFILKSLGFRSVKGPPHKSQEL